MNIHLAMLVALCGVLEDPASTLARFEADRAAVAATAPAERAALLEQLLQDRAAFIADFYQVSITGPFQVTGPGNAPSRRRIFICRPTGPEDEDACARRILSQLLRRAYRRPIDEEDLATRMKFFAAGGGVGGFDVGVERAEAAILVNPGFLCRMERRPANAPAT